MSIDHLRRYVRDVPDFPKPGILFRDITPLLGDGKAFAEAIDALAAIARTVKAERIAAPESRGFIFGAPVAARLGVGFAPIRKPGKLPAKKRRLTYSLEYGTDVLEMHDDAIRPGERVLLVDDLLATGGTIRACADLVEAVGGQVAGFAFVIELLALLGRERLGVRPVHALLAY
ncbi:MAG TPA: adenine phosphoribosyltransferase [Planctomycetota bacterium]|nr:adenine phosphoribosyltransferase [Planctomycetota bacterium]